MPELPEVETVRRGLQQAITGKTIKNVRLSQLRLRFPLPERFGARLTDRRVEKVERRAKYLLIHLDGGLVLLAHLGMSGHFRMMRSSSEAVAQNNQLKHDHVMFSFTDGTSMAFNDPRRFGFMDLVPEKGLKTHKLLARLGPEPLGKEFTSAYLEAALAGRRGPVKPAIMNQQLVVGVGNIYASEALFSAGIDPRTPANAASAHAEPLVKAIRAVLENAIASGGSSLRDFFHTDGETGLFQHRFQVYGRAGKPCFTCGCAIHPLRQAGRATYFCSHCQHPLRVSAYKAKKPRKTAPPRATKKVTLGA